MTAPTRVAPPPYRLVLPASADRADWLAARRRGIGSSDVPQVLGVSEYGSPQHVYYEKRGELPDRDDVGEAALWGQLHEETVAREWARRNRSVVRRIGLVARKDPGMGHHMCTLDRRCDECPLNRRQRERCAVEVKTRNAFVAGKWKRSIPDDVLAQVVWQLHVTGYDHIHVAVLIGGNDFRQFVVYRKDHEQLIGNLVTVVDKLWRDIALGNVPPLTGSENSEAMLDLYDKLHPNRTGALSLDEFPARLVRFGEDVYDYETGRLEEKAGKAKKEAAKVSLIEALGNRCLALLEGDMAYELQERDGREKCNFVLLQEKYPEVYKECVSRKPYDQLVIAKAHRLTEIPDEMPPTGRRPGSSPIVSW